MGFGYWGLGIRFWVLGSRYWVLVKAEQHLTMDASGLSGRTEIWETIKGIQTVSSFNP